MQLNHIIAEAQDHDRGRELELHDPATGEPTGIKLRIAGPDSATQNRARLNLSDAMAEAADPSGRVSAEVRECLRVESLAACVLGWEIEEDGQQVPFTQAHVVRLLRSSQWVQAQVDAFAADYAAFRGGV